ncbi:MAG: GHKL domain-containing protein [Kineothrix sp.]|nr:GHKL domain-containing protein [Kineothrix sp.]
MILLTSLKSLAFDNTIEETAKITNGIIEIGIRNNKTSCSYIIKSPLTPQTQQTGIHIGKTTKGDGRGKGLLIVQQLISQYPNAVLNTSICQSTYIQCLNISYMLYQ